MNDATETLLDDLAELRFREFLRSLSPTDVVVADPATAHEFERGFHGDPPFGLVPIERALAGARELAGAERLIVCVCDAERAQAARIDDLYPDVETVGLAGDVLPRLAARRPTDFQERAPERGYAILGLPRSGSYHLCGLLAELGFGRPDEHLKSGICRAARRGMVDLETYFDALAGVAVENGWFATKLISSVLFEAFESGFPPNDFVDWLQRHALRTVALRRHDRVAQAVSFFFARHTGIWSAQRDRPEPERPPYDFDAIRTEWKDLGQQQDWLDQLIALLPQPPHPIDYEDLDARPAETLADLIGFLTGARPDPAEIEVRPRTRRQRDELSDEYVRRFRADLRARGG